MDDSNFNNSDWNPKNLGMESTEVIISNSREFIDPIVVIWGAEDDGRIILIIFDRFSDIDKNFDNYEFYDKEIR